MLEADYLIVGSGAVGMAFADVLAHESEATMIIVDRYHKPGGHWNVAYPFVTLHQPSAFYGVSSVELSKGRTDKVGFNKGLNDLASGAEVSAYFDEVMRHKLLPTDRVQYYPMCEYKGDGKFESKLTGESYEVKVNKKTIDATYLNTSVPSTHTPSFEIGDGVNFIPINDLPKIQNPPDQFVIIGGGKTGIDACLWLLENRVSPDKITWVLSRDAWLINRRNTQPSEEFFEDFMESQINQFEAIIAADDIDDLFSRLEKAEVLFRLDSLVKPKMFHGATVSKLELEQLRRIKNIVRKGRVQRLEKEKMLLVEGEHSVPVNTVYIDCSASAITNFKMQDIFQEDLIIPQTVRSYQPVFSAALIAHIELAYDNDKKKNELTRVVPLPNHDTDWLKMMGVFMMNQFNWGQDAELRKWLYNNRLDGFSKLVKDASKENKERQALIRKMRDVSMPAAMKLQQLLQTI